MSTALLFAGQGSQYVGMVRDLVQDFSLAQTMMQQADDIMGTSLSEICFNGPAELLRETRYTQPALFVHEAILVAVLREQARDTFVYSTVAGHSLGEYSALFAAHVLDFETALRLVKLRGELMFAAGADRPGTMAAVIGMADEAVAELCAQITGSANGEQVIVPANYNCPGQLVVSGDAELVRASLPQFKAGGAKIAKELPVSGAFHSPLMKPAQDELAKAIHTAHFSSASVDVYVNTTAQALRSAQALQAALINQLVQPVQWTQSLQAMYSAGIREYIEIGPGNVLQGLTKRTVSDATIRGIDTAEHVRSFGE
jgi:[acyl-carrier-protein] S-malonyltransferase